MILKVYSEFGGDLPVLFSLGERGFWPPCVDENSHVAVSHLSTPGFRRVFSPENEVIALIYHLLPPHSQGNSVRT